MIYITPEKNTLQTDCESSARAAGARCSQKAVKGDQPTTFDDPIKMTPIGVKTCHQTYYFFRLITLG